MILGKIPMIILGFIMGLTTYMIYYLRNYKINSWFYVPGNVKVNIESFMKVSIIM